MTEEQFYLLWEKFAYSTLVDYLPDDVPQECERLGISIEYFLLEFV
jgi:hypothetical protein